MVSIECWNRSATRQEESPVTHVYRNIPSCSSTVTFHESRTPFSLRIRVSTENISRGTPKFILMRLGCPVNNSRMHAWPVRMDMWWGMCGDIERTWWRTWVICTRMMVNKTSKCLQQVMKSIVTASSWPGSSCTSRSRSISMVVVDSNHSLTTATIAMSRV